MSCLARFVPSKIHLQNVHCRSLTEASATNNGPCLLKMQALGTGIGVVRRLDSASKCWGKDN